MKRSHQALAFLLARLVPLRQRVLDLVFGEMQGTLGEPSYHSLETLRLPHEPPRVVRVAVSVDSYRRPRSRRPPLAVYRVLLVPEKPIPTGVFHNGAPVPVREMRTSVVDARSEEFAVQEAMDRLTRSIIRARLGVG